MINTDILPTDIPVETPINNPTDFPIGSRINVINHLKYGGKHGIVRGHSNMTKAIRILPKFLQPRTNFTQTYIPLCNCTHAHRQLSMPKVMKNKKSEEPNDDNIKRDHYIYDKLDETQDFKVADGIVSFTRKFRYLGSLISYNLRDDEDIKARIAAANASMGALKEIWSNPHLDTYNKYLLFRVLWGCESWSLRQSLLDKLEVFLHKSIRCILKISMSRVINKKLRNEQVRTSFIQCLASGT